MKSYRRLGFEYEEAGEIVDKMNLLIANYQVHFHKLQAFHWNVRGRDFFELHTQFEHMYRRAFENIDNVAERIRVFNLSPVSTMQMYLEQSTLVETNRQLSGDKMVKVIIEDFETLLGLMIDVVNLASKNGDVGTIDLINTIIKQMEKDHWMLTAWLTSVETPELISSN